jgi:hypothetical protein
MNRRFWIRAVVPALAAGLAAAPCVAAPAGFGTLTGRTPPSAGVLARHLPPSVLALRLAPGLGQAAVVPNAARRWSLRVEPGPYAIVTTTWGARGAVTSVSLATVRRGARVRVAAGEPATATAARVSIGSVRGPGGQDLEPLVTTSLVSAAETAPCDYEVVVDRQSRGYKEVLKELQFNTTKYFPEATRRAAVKALRSQAALSPQYTVQGTVTDLGGPYSGATSGTFRLVQTGSGKVIWEERISLQDGGSEGLFDLLAKAVNRAVCDVPAAFVGSVESTITAPGLTSQKWIWSGTAAFVLSGGGEQPDGTFRFEYDLDRLEVASSRYTLTEPCVTALAEWSGPAPASRNGSLILTVRADNSRDYTINLGWLSPTTPATHTDTCSKPPASITLPLTIGGGLVSAPRVPWLGPAPAGTYDGPWTNPVAANPFQMTGSWSLQPLTDPG